MTMLHKEPGMKIAIAVSNYANYKIPNADSYLFARALNYATLAKKLREGYSIAFDYREGNEFRHIQKENFKGADFLCLDFDNDKDLKITIDDIRECKTKQGTYLKENSLILFTTQNHQKNGNGDRYKILFHLPHTVREWSSLNEIFLALKEKFPESCQGNNLTGYYYGGGENAEVICFGNRLSEQALDELTSERRKILEAEGKENLKTNIGGNHMGLSTMDKGINTRDQIAKELNWGKFAQADPYWQKAYDEELHRLARAVKGERDKTLSSAAFKIGQFAHGIDLTDEQIIDNIIKVAESVGIDKSFTSKKINSTAKKAFASGLKNPRTDYYSSDYSIDTTSHRRLFSNLPKAGHVQAPKALLDIYPKAKDEAKMKLLNIDSTSDFEFFEIADRIFEDVSVSCLRSLLKYIQNPDILKLYLSLWRYAELNKKKLHTSTEGGFYILNDVDINDIIDILNPDVVLSKQHRYRKREEFKQNLKKLGSIIFFVENPSSKVKGKNMLKIDPTGSFSIIDNKLKYFLPFQLKSIGSYFPENIFKLTANDKTALSLVVGIYRRANQVYISQKDNGYAPPDFHKVEIPREEAIKIAGLELSDSLNTTETDKSLKEALQKLSKIGCGHGKLIDSHKKGKYISFSFPQKNPKVNNPVNEGKQLS